MSKLCANRKGLTDLKQANRQSHALVCACCVRQCRQTVSSLLPIIPSAVPLEPGIFPNNLGQQISFVLMPSNFWSPDLIPQNKAPRVFIMEFHLSYCALRTGKSSWDNRGLRGAQSMVPFYIEPPEPSQPPHEQLFYHDVQISFLMTGVDEWYWTAYCCVDTLSEDTENPQTYDDIGADGPSGGARQGYPVWNPREYFLLVLSRRWKQVTREWETMIEELLARLDTYVRSSCPRHSIRFR